MPISMYILIQPLNSLRRESVHDVEMKVLGLDPYYEPQDVTQNQTIHAKHKSP